MDSVFLASIGEGADDFSGMGRQHAALTFTCCEALFGTWETSLRPGIDQLGNGL